MISTALIFVFTALSPCLDQFHIRAGPVDDKSLYDCLEEDDFLWNNYTWQSNGGSYTIDFEMEEITCDGTSFSKLNDGDSIDYYKCVNGEEYVVNTTWLDDGLITLYGDPHSFIHLLHDRAIVFKDGAMKIVLWKDGEKEFYTGKPKYERLIQRRFPDNRRQFYSGSMGREKVTKIVLPCGETRFYKNGKLVNVKFPDDEYGDGAASTPSKTNLTQLWCCMSIMLSLALFYFCFVFTRPVVSSDDGRSMSERLADIRMRRALHLLETDRRFANAYRKRLLMLQRSEDAKQRAAERLQRDQEDARLRAREAERQREEQIRRSKEIHDKQAQDEADEERRRRDRLDEERRARQEDRYRNDNMQPRAPVRPPARRGREPRPVLTPEEEEQARVRKINGRIAQKEHERRLKKQMDEMIEFQFWQEQQLHIADLIGRLE